MLIKNALIATASDVYKGDIYIKDSVISQIGENLVIENEEKEEIIDAKGNYVIPGGIDVHTHFSLDVGIAVSNDDFRTGTIAAACGGTTSIVDHIGQGPVGSTLRSRIEHYHGLAEGKAVIDYSFHGVIAYDTDEQKLKDMKELIEEGIESYKIYMTYGQRIDDEGAIKVLKTAKENNAIVSVHPENHDTIEFLKKYYVENGMTSPIYHAKSRPEECEAEAINRIINIAHLLGDAPIYIVHLSSNMGLDYVKMARERGQKNIFVETCTQYLVLDEELYKLPGTEGLKYVMSPPLRNKANQEKLWQGIKNGDIQVVATDHCPFSYEKEKVPMGKDNFAKCPNGAPGVEARMPVLFSEGVMKGRISINKFVEVTSTNPAKICGMYPKKGSIAVGSDADLVIIDKDRKVTITKDLFHENVDYTSYEGIELQGYPIMTIVRGKVIVRENKFVGDEGYGEFIKRYKNDEYVRY